MSNEQNEEGKRDFILALNEEQREWVDKDDEEPLLLHVLTWDALTGICSQTAAVPKGGRFGHQGVEPWL